MKQCWFWFLVSPVLLNAQALPSFTEYLVPTANSQPSGITNGPDGALWFTERNTNKIGRISTDGTITEYVVPTAASDPTAITSGPDGALWFTEYGANKVGRITVAGVITEYAVPTSTDVPSCTTDVCSSAYDITTGPDGALWFIETSLNFTVAPSAIGRITTGGSVVEYPTPTTYGDASNIVSGPDGALWFTDYQGSNIGRASTSGLLAEYPTPTGYSLPYGITAGPDGALWFTESLAGNIGRITTAGSITEYHVPNNQSGPAGIAAGPDGSLWFADQGADDIGRITTAGVITEYPIPTVDSQPLGIATGPDGALWFTEYGANKIGRISPCPVNLILGTVGQYIEASFTPPPILGNPNPSLTEYASFCEFTSFDWQQQITVLPAGDSAVQPNNPGPLIASGNVVYLDAIVSPTDGHCVGDWTNCSLIAPPAFADPPVGGYTYQPGFNPYPFYYPVLDFFAYPDLYCTTASGGCPPFPYQVSSDGKTLSFVDGPQNQTLPNPPVPGQFQAFKTSLVGVDANENAHPLYTWTWNTTYNGTAGAVAVTSVNGVAITACDITYNETAGVADVQSMVNQVLGLSPAVSDLTHDGVVNVLDLQIVINAALGLGCSAS